MANAYICGIGVTQLGKFPDRSVKDLTAEAVAAALSDAHLDLGDIEAAWFSNTRQGLLEGQNAIRGQAALRSMGFQGIPIVNVENACASGSTAMREAVAFVRGGLHDVVLVVGAEKMFFPEKREEMFRAFIGGTDVHRLPQLKSQLAALSKSPKAVADGEGGEHSLFMDIYAAIAQLHMQMFGTTQRQIAAAAAKNHRHSTLNPFSQYRQDMSVEEVLADRTIAWPLTRSMCAPISDGAAAAVVCSERALRRRGLSRAVRVAALALRSSTDRPPDDFDAHIGRLTALEAYQHASIDPSEVGVAEVHDACAFAEIVQIENLGLCARGDGGPASERGDTSLGGRVPVNPSGGLVSKGHPVGATGIIQYHELVTQLRGEAGSRQVEGARVAVAENGGGFWGLEEAATTVTVLVRD